MPSTTDKEFLIRVKADIEKAVKDMRRMTGEIEKQGKGGEKTKKSLAGLGGGYRNLAAAAAAYVTVATAIKALRMADEYNILQRRIKTATRETGDYVAVSGDLYQITQRNGTALKDTVDIFQRLSLQSKALGATNDEILTLTDTVQKLGVIGGSSQAAMAAGLMQFSQAMASGTVRAEEINSIMENLPELAVRIEKGLKLLPGTLKQAVNEGKVLSKDVFQAILKMAPEIAREFTGIPIDMQRSTQTLSNSFSRFLSALDDATGTTALIASNMQSAAKSLDDYADSRSVQGQLLAKRLALESRIAQITNDGALATTHLYQSLRVELNALNRELGQMNWIEYQAMLKGVNAEMKAMKFNAGKDLVIDPKMQEQLSKMVKTLEFQAATWGKTAGQIALYRIELELGNKVATEFGKVTLKNARIAVARIESLVAQEKATRALTEAERDFMTASYENEMAQRERQGEAEADFMTETWEYVKAQRELLNTVLDSVDPFRAYYRELKNFAQLAEQFPEHADQINLAMEQLTAGLEEGPPESLANATDKMSEFAVQAARNIQSSFADFLFDPFSDGMDGMLAGFVRTLQRMASEMLAQAALMAFFKAMAGGDSSSIWMKMAGAVMHDGGIVGQGGASRMVSPLLFAGAPRYHSGGIAGLKPLEMPAILQKGEEVLPRSDPRHAANGGGAGQPLSVTIVDDRASLDQYMPTPAAGQHIVTHIKRNAQVIKGILG